MAPQKWPKCDASKWTDGQMVRQRRRRHFICSSTATSGRHLCAAIRTSSPTVDHFLHFCHFCSRSGCQRRAKSCKLMATGAHSKRFHYCHKLRQQRLRRRRLREIALKNFPTVLFDFRYVIFKWLPKRHRHRHERKQQNALATFLLTCADFSLGLLLPALLYPVKSFKEGGLAAAEIVKREKELAY